MAKIPEFKFDFEAVEGMELAEGMVALYVQLQAHYNKHIKPAPILLGGKRFSAPAGPDTEVVAVTESSDPVKKSPVKGIDVETITPDTKQLADFSIRDSAMGDRKMIVGKDVAGNVINDILLPGYDVEPLGPVVSGEQGRYNLKISK